MQNLPDVQNTKDARGVSLERVGLTNVKFPVKIKRKDDVFIDASANVKLFANLPAHAKGHNLSRFNEVLVKFGETHDRVLNFDTLEDLLFDMQKRLGSDDVYARFEFDYYIDKKAPVSKKSAPMSYLCAFEGIKKKEDAFFFVEVNVVAASVCPCSKEMSLLKNEYVVKDILKNFPKNQNIDDNVNYLCKEVGEFVGLGAHNQRSLIKVEVQLSKDNFIFLEDLIKNVENQASAPTFPILKRPDERWVTEKGYNNPKFSEDIARDLQIMLQKDTRIVAWSLKVENEESIHPFNVMSSSKSKNWNFY